MVIITMEAKLKTQITPNPSVIKESPTIGKSTDLLENVLPTVLDELSKVNLTVVAEELLAPHGEILDCFVRKAIKSRCQLDVRVLTQSIRDAHEAVLNLHTIQTQAANTIVSELGRIATDDEIMANLRLRVEKNKSTQDRVSSWKRAFRSAGRPDTAVMQYRAHALRPDNDFLTVSFEHTATRDCQIVTLVTPRQHGCEDASWMGVVVKPDTSLFRHAHLTSELLWQTGNPRPLRILDYESHFRNLLAEWHKMRQVVDRHNETMDMDDDHQHISKRLDDLRGRRDEGGSDWWTLFGLFH